MNPAAWAAAWAARRRDRAVRRVHVVVNHPVRERSLLLTVAVWSQILAVGTIFALGNLARRTDVPGVPGIAYQCPTGGQAYDYKPVAWLERMSGQPEGGTQAASWPPKWSKTPWRIPGWLWQGRNKKLGDYSPLPTTLVGSANLLFTVEAYIIRRLMPALPDGKLDVTWSGVQAAAGLATGPAGGSAAPAPQLPTAGTLSGVQVASAARAAGFTGDALVTAVTVARAESGWRPDASHVNSNGSTDHGLWQINSVHASLLAAGDWRDPVANARMAYAVSSGGANWTPWTVFNSGGYRQYLSDAQAAVAALDGQPPIVQVAYNPAAGCDGQPQIVQASAGGTAACPPSGSSAERGLTPNALRVLRCVDANFGSHVYGGVGSRPNNPSSDHPHGRAVDIMIDGWQSAAGNAEGWRIAEWTRANAEALGVSYVIFDAKWWQIGDAGWSAYSHPSGAQDATNMHRDHVHVSVS